MVNRKFDQLFAVGATAVIIAAAVGAVGPQRAFRDVAGNEAVCGHLYCWEDYGSSEIHGTAQLGFEGTAGTVVGTMEMHADFSGSGTHGQSCAGLIQSVLHQVQQLGGTPGPRKVNIGIARSFEGFAFAAEGSREEMVSLIGGLGEELMAAAANLPGQEAAAVIGTEERDETAISWPDAPRRPEPREQFRR